jgi:3'(2'), 5'-bisphosphate nucleotidase
LTRIALLAGDAIMRIACEDRTAQSKADGSVVTRADYESEAIILGELTHLFPRAMIISEESCPPLSAPLKVREFFLVDPLDGTREFAAGSDEFTVNIALIQDGIPVAGIVAAPAQALLWRGGAKLGAQRLRSGGEHAPPEPIATRRWPAAEIVAAVSRSHLDADTVALLSGLGSVAQMPCGSAVKFCWLAEGLADLYPRLAPTREWDVAAGHAVLSAAGGAVVRPDGRDLSYGSTTDFLVPAFIALADPSALREVMPAAPSRAS